jgi:prepilin-type N-terminal cleavage/methylation domain-containing protein
MKNKGFTLIEILAAVAIVGILSSFVVIQMNGAANATKDTKRKADIDLIKNAIISYRSENFSTTPAETCNLEDCTTLPTALSAFIATLPTDPDGQSYVYSSDGTDCTLYATLSDGTIYRYSCDNNVTATLTPVNGVCGGDNGASLIGTPTNLCNVGTASPITGSGPWWWSCAGENEGTAGTCMAYLSDVFGCTVTNGTCAGTDMFHIYDPAGGHAELSSQSMFAYKVCCTGGGVTNQCAGSYATVLKLYDTSNCHAEKGTLSNYTNSICISATGKTATCTYTDSACESGYVCLASISDGDTSVHVGDCSAFTTKVCCKVSSY